MKKSMMAALGAVMFLGMASAAYAQMPNLMAADANKDGKITKDESWNAKDTNKDGFLTSEELGQAAQIYMPLDANKDGKLDKAEYFSANSPFIKWDKDKDGALTEAELTAGIQALMSGQ